MKDSHPTGPLPCFDLSQIFFNTISGTPVKSEEGESETDEGSLPSRRRRQSSGSSFTMPSTSSAELLTPGKQNTTTFVSLVE